MQVLFPVRKIGAQLGKPRSHLGFALGLQLILAFTLVVTIHGHQLPSQCAFYLFCTTAWCLSISTSFYLRAHSFLPI